MPLVPCPDCGRQLSTEAPACPQCGRPMRVSPYGPQQAYPPQGGWQAPYHSQPYHHPGPSPSQPQIVVMQAPPTHAQQAVVVKGGSSGSGCAAVLAVGFIIFVIILVAALTH